LATAQGPQRVSAADFIRGFANWRLQAAREPVVVTHHGKDAHVLISLDDYRKLAGGAASTDHLRDSLGSLVEAIRDGVIVVDRHMRIVSVNPAASDMLERSAADLLHQNLIDALPGVGTGVLLSHLNRMIAHRERFSGNLPGVLRPRQWLRVDLVPLPVGGALLMRDTSDMMEEVEVADARQALSDALGAHGAIGCAHISVREMIEDANSCLTGMVGVDPAAIRRVRFSALLAMRDRTAFADALEGVFRNSVPVRFAASLVTREGQAVPVTLSIAERRGAYASDGAVVLVTRD